MRYLSLFSGMEAAHLAWHPLGWECAGVSEIDPNACALLRHRLPDVPNLGSVTEITDEAIAALGPIDVVIGGSPCQDLSVAGKRKGLAGARSGLFHEQMRIFHAARHLCGARWLVWENVPGAFSSNAGRDFAVVVGDMAGLELAVPEDGWGNEGVAVGANGLVEWSVLDAQWFGVAQRRRRVFAVLDTGNWTDRPPVLLEPESLRGDSAPRREAGQGTSRGVANGLDGGDVARALTACSTATGRLDPNEQTFVLDVAPTLQANGRSAGSATQQDAENGLLIPVAFVHQAGGVQTTLGYDPDAGTAPTLSVCQMPAVHTAVGVRRMTPLEHERLQGAREGWTAVPNAKGKPMADGPRYKMLGNSFAVPVIRWIGVQLERAAASRARQAA